MQLTQASARQITLGEEIRCHVVKGLSLRCKARGAAWFLEYRSPIDGKRRRPKLGSFPALSVEGARSAARSILHRVATGEDPSAERQERRHAPTVADLHAWFMDNHSRPHKAAYSAKYDQWYFDRFLADGLGGLKVRDVTAADINRTLAKIAADTSGTTANRVRALLSTMFVFAESDALGWREKRSNPITKKDVPVRPEFPRRRFLTTDELQRLGPAFADASRTHPRHVAALLCILYAGSRVTELVTAKWDHVEGRSIVRTDHKASRTGRHRTIRLPDQAWHLIGQLPQHAGGWIFGEDVTVDSVHRIWDGIRKSVGLEDVQVKDFRRTFASMLRSSGRTLSDVGALLGHANPAVTDRHYAFLFDDKANEAVQGAADRTAGMLPGLARPVAPLEDKGR